MNSSDICQFIHRHYMYACINISHGMQAPSICLAQIIAFRLEKSIQKNTLFSLLHLIPLLALKPGIHSSARQLRLRHNLLWFSTKLLLCNFLFKIEIHRLHQNAAMVWIGSREKILFTGLCGIYRERRWEFLAENIWLDIGEWRGKKMDWNCSLFFSISIAPVSAATAAEFLLVAACWWLPFLPQRSHGRDATSSDGFRGWEGKGEQELCLLLLPPASTI